MHPIVIYELVTSRIELDRAAERRRLARAETPLIQQASAGSRPPAARWGRAIRRRPWISPSSRDEELARMPPRRFREAGDGLAEASVPEPRKKVARRRAGPRNRTAARHLR